MVQCKIQASTCTQPYFVTMEDLKISFFARNQALNAASNSAQMKTETQRAQAIEVDDIVLEQNQSCNTEGNTWNLIY